MNSKPERLKLICAGTMSGLTHVAILWFKHLLVNKIYYIKIEVTVSLHVRFLLINLL